MRSRAGDDGLHLHLRNKQRRTIPDQTENPTRPHDMARTSSICLELTSTKGRTELMERRLQARSISVIVYDEEMPLRYRAFDLMHFTQQARAEEVRRLPARRPALAGVTKAAGA